MLHGRILTDTLEEQMKLNIKIVPGSSRNCITGWLGESLKVCVKTPAEKGKANTAVEKMIATALGTSANRTKIIRGKTSSRKVIEISGLSASEVYERLEYK